MKKILGLDIGTTSIGWAIAEATDEKRVDGITGKETETDINNDRVGIHKDAVGIRIIAQDTERFDRGETLNDPKGSTLTPAANRRKYRGARRMRNRYKLRRGKLEHILAFISMNPDKAYYTNNKGKRGTYNDIGKAIYQLRSRAITEEITLNELGRILIHLNQWRGYSSDRFAKEEKPKFDYWVVEVLAIDDMNKVAIYEKNSKEEIKYYEFSIKVRFAEPYNLGDTEKDNTVTELSGFIYKKEIKFKQGDFITIKRPELRQVKKGKTVISEYYTITDTIPDPTDWNYKYQTLEKRLAEWCEAGGTVGSYFYQNFYETTILPRIRNNVVNRRWYEDELNKILDFQYSVHKDFFDNLNIEGLVKAAFKDYAPVLAAVTSKIGIKEQLKCLIRDKVIFFQRPWQQAKNKGQCPFEKIRIKKKVTIKGTGREDVVEDYVGRTVIPRSHPLFQEFKIWQQINNVRIYAKIAGVKVDLFADENDFKNYVGKGIREVKNMLYDALQQSKTLSWKNFAENQLGLRNKKEIVDISTGELIKCDFEYNFRKQKKDGNYEDIKLKGNTTRVALANVLPDEADDWFDEIHSDRQAISNLQLLWELIYDITNGDVLKVAAIIGKHFCFDTDICLSLANLKFDDAGMGNLSAKAIRQILPLMSNGEGLTNKTLTKVNALIDFNNSASEMEAEEKLASLRDIIPDKKARQRLSGFTAISDFSYLNYWEATAVRYGSHSAPKRMVIGSMKRVEQHSMNNPVVEKIVNETISIVNELYKVYGFDEVRIELSRELKASREERQQIWESMNANADRNEWAKQMLREMKREFAGLDTDASNKSNIDKIKIIEDVIKYKYASEYKVKEKEYNLTEPSKADVKRYLMWLEQNFKCPYTNQPIPFTDVFAHNKAVEIEHIIPLERYYLNSYSNKVITWREINQAKADYGNRTAYEFIVSKRKDDFIVLSDGRKVPLVAKDRWEEHIKAMFPRGAKQANLLRKEIPEDPVNRTMKETQYINKKLKEKLGELVGDKKVWVTSGAVTDILRDRWHLNNVMKELVRDRFENFELPTGKKTFRLKTLEEQERVLNEIGKILEGTDDFTTYEIPAGKKVIELTEIEELRTVYAELAEVINENTFTGSKKVTPYVYSTSESAYETKSLVHITSQINTKTGHYQDREVFNGYSKRLDHRHHALDAIIIACTKQNHIQYINTLNAINSADQESDESRKRKYALLKADICIGNSSKAFKTPWVENEFLPRVKEVLSGIVISHKNTRLLISPSRHRNKKGIESGMLASIRGELHKETNYAKRSYFNGGKTPVIKLIPNIFEAKFKNQSQTMVHWKTFSEIIRETVLKEKYQAILIPLFDQYEEIVLSRTLCKEYGSIVLNRIHTENLLVNSGTNQPLQWLSTYAEKDKSARPNGLSMDLNSKKEVDSIADPRIKRIAGYRLNYVNERKAAIDKLEIDKKEKDAHKRKVEALPLYSNAIYEIRIRLNDKEYKWIELKDITQADVEKISYPEPLNHVAGKVGNTERVKKILMEVGIEVAKHTYFDNPIFLSDNPIEVKKTRQLSYYQKSLYEITPKRYVQVEETFMTYFFKEKKSHSNLNISNPLIPKFLKFIDAVNIVNNEKPSAIRYKDLIQQEITNEELQNGVEYDLVFTLSKNDLVYLPDKVLSAEELEAIDWTDFATINKDIYIVKDMNQSQKKIVFQQQFKAESITISAVDASAIFGNEQLKEQVEEIKYGNIPMLQRCIKVFTDKLGKKIVPYWKFPNGCWDRQSARELGLINRDAE